MKVKRFIYGPTISERAEAINKISRHLVQSSFGFIQTNFGQLHSWVFCYSFQLVEIHIPVLQPNTRNRATIIEEYDRTQNGPMFHLIESEQALQSVCHSMHPGE